MNIVVKNLQHKVHINKNHTKSLIQQLANLVNLSEKSTVTVVFVDNKAMQELNHRYLKHDFPTDVLAFKFSRHRVKQKTSLVGDVIVNTEMALKNAPIYKNPLKKEITLYIIHGILHLLGFNDAGAAERKRMQTHQQQLLNKLFLE